MDSLARTGRRPDLTFGQFWQHYAAGPLLDKPHGTQRIERQAWSRACLTWVPEGRTHPFWELQRISQVRSEMVQRYQAFRRKSGHSRATIAQELSLLRVMANLAVEYDLCAAPKVKWSVPRPVARKQKPIDEVTFKRLLGAATPRQQAMLRWLWETGARPNELLEIRREDLRPDLGTVRIPTPKTGRRKGITTRVFFPTDEMITAIRERDEWLRSIIESKERRFGVGPVEASAQLESDWLFPALRGNRMARNGYRPALDSAYRKAGVSGRDLYAFRHAYHTRWLANAGLLTWTEISRSFC